MTGKPSLWPQHGGLSSATLSCHRLRLPATPPPHSQSPLQIRRGRRALKQAHTPAGEWSPDVLPGRWGGLGLDGPHAGRFLENVTKRGQKERGNTFCSPRTMFEILKKKRGGNPGSWLPFRKFKSRISVDRFRPADLRSWHQALTPYH